MIEKTCRANLVKIAKAYAKATDRSLATVSRRFHGNHAFLTDFASGEISITLPKYDEMLAAFAAEWPEGARWPDLKPYPLPTGPGIKVAKAVDSPAPV